MEEEETLLLNGKATNFASLQPLQSEICCVFKFLNAHIETKYFKWEAETCPKRGCPK